MVTDEPICKAEIGIQTDRTNVWTPSGGRGMVGWDELGDWDRHIYPTAHKMGFPDGSAGKESTRNAGDTGDAGSIPGSGRSPGRGNGSPLQYSCLEDPTDRGAWWATVHGVTESRTRLRD